MFMGYLLLSPSGTFLVNISFHLKLNKFPLNEKISHLFSSRIDSLVLETKAQGEKYSRNKVQIEEEELVIKI